MIKLLEWLKDNPLFALGLSLVIFLMLLTICGFVDDIITTSLKIIHGYHGS